MNIEEYKNFLFKDIERRLWWIETLRVPFTHYVDNSKLTKKEKETFLKLVDSFLKDVHFEYNGKKSSDILK